MLSQMNLIYILIFLFFVGCFNFIFLCLPSKLYPSVIQIKFFIHFSPLPAIHTTCLTHLFIHNLITIMISCKNAHYETFHTFPFSLVLSLVYKKKNEIYFSMFQNLRKVLPVVLIILSTVTLFFFTKR